MLRGRYERRITGTVARVIRTTPDGMVDVLNERSIECCATCIYAFRRLVYAVWPGLSCKISGDGVTDDWHCNAYEEVAP